MLAGDPALAAELNQIRTAQEAVMAAIGALDQSAPLRVSTPVATRQISRLMKQWQVDRLTRRPAVTEKRSLRFPWWAYPAASAATAAGLLMALMVWWGLKADNMPTAGARIGGDGTGHGGDGRPGFDAEPGCRAGGFADVRREQSLDRAGATGVTIARGAQMNLPSRHRFS